MPRNARIVVPDIAHHITQRGNNKQDVFFVDDDRRKFLELIGEQSGKFGAVIDGFHIGRDDEFGLMDIKRWRRKSSGLDWKNVLRAKLETDDLDKLRIYCRTGRPLGTDKFISKLETVIGRRLRPLPVGRPKKTKDKKVNKK